MSVKQSAERPEYPEPQWIIVAALMGVGILFMISAYSEEGLQFLLLYVVGICIGFTLFHTNYGFSTVYKQLLEDGNTEMLRGHMQKLLIAGSLFALVLGTQTAFFNENPEGAISPIGAGLIVGAFLFGFGMNIGSNLAPQAMRTMKGGRTALLFTVSGFVVGSTAGAAHFPFWNHTLGGIGEISLADNTPLGYFGAWIVQSTIFIGVIIGTHLHQKRKMPPPLPKMPKGTHWREVIFLSWPIWVGATVFALLNVAVLMIQGTPWKVTAAFTLWGSKLSQYVGFDPASWRYWGEEEAVTELTNSLFASSVGVLNMGIAVGALLTMALAGLMRFSKISLQAAAVALLGGLLMGYGAAISFGANVGAYFSGIASMSLHAWLWTFMAVAGVYTAYYASRKLPFLKSN
ncbi:YeeE/YedE thiosulfate transporter family protein [Alkalicoccus saliphilus]|uniref:Uncharacterized protein n=1 Tax=Alkalicoccus saliphilus TaxID=200989 RepID=A0A2T4U4D4_9BACI|nr:YeeE/YedE thiosulfate transporter family protein [Alkalicoccus saliphilus]PTL38261.1 hypothetical protein C6Y45_12100 [Alkalicoccus saliphilus]